MRLELDALAREHEARPPGAARGDLIERATRALEACRTGGVAEFLVVAAARLGTLLNDTGRPGDALTILASHEGGLGVLREHPLGIAFRQQHLRALAAVARSRSPQVASPAWREVEERASEMIERVEQLRLRVSVPDLFNAYTRYSIQIYAIAVEARMALGDPAGALRCTELVKCRSLHRLLAGGTAGGSAALQAEFRELSRRLDQLPPDQPVPPALPARRRALWDRIAAERFTERAEILPSFTVNALQRALPPDLAVVSWFWLDDVRFLVAAMNREQAVIRIARVDSAASAQMREQAAAILGFQEGGSTQVTRLPAALGDVLFPEAVRALLEPARRLVLSPHRALHALPLQSLTWEGRTPLGRRFALSYAPNLTTLLTPAAPRRERRVLFVGVPERAPGHVARPLAGVYAELDGVRAALPGGAVRALVGEAAREGDLARLSESGELAGFDLVHFACHGTSVDSDSPMESRLLLYDSDLDGLDIAQWRMDADVVVLSACSAGQRPVSGRGLHELPGDELYGLQAALVAAGARQVLATNWPVRDDVAAAITAAFHRELLQHPADIALQRAIAAYCDANPVAARMPHLWACWFLTTVRMPRASTGDGDAEG